MNNEYDSTTALHYASYRPSLHAQILKFYLQTDEKFQIGLDVGCGTGKSAISLSSYCSKVIGVDPSKEMLNKSIIQTKVSYQLMKPNQLDFKNNTFDIVTFAGSLFYAKSQELLNETIRVSKNNSKIIIYDFEVFMEDAFKLLEIDNTTVSKSNYDHQINFSGLDEKSIMLKEQLNQKVDFKITIPNLAHLLLAAKEDYVRIVQKFGSENLYDNLILELSNKLGSTTTTLKANTYLTAYTAIK